MTATPALTVDAAQIQARFEAFGAPEVLSVARDPSPPEPGPGEVRVRVEASSVQYTDTLIRRGIYPEVRGPFPLTPGYDFVGVVDAVGLEVSAWQVGDRVADLCVIGGNARYVVRPAAGLVRVPEAVDAAAATTLVLSWLTAYQALVRTARLAAGERLLVTGGNGAVGLAAIAVAVQLGAEVYATAGERHHAALRALGANPLPREGWQVEIARLGGVDVALDGVAADGYVSPYRALRGGGRLVTIGMIANERRFFDLALALARTALWGLWPWAHETTFYSITRERSRDPQAFREDLGQLFTWLEQGAIRPEVAERIDFAQIADAHARLERGGLSGKIVLTP
jgi:NADPH2:quinone reductase